MKKQGFTFVLICLPWMAIAQFNLTMGTFKDQVGYSTQLSQFDSGFIAAGEDGHTVFGGTEASLVKTKSNGGLLWSTVYGGIGNELFTSVREVIPSRAQGFAALGTTTSFTNTEDLYFVRTDPSGTPLFSFTFGTKGGTEKGHYLQYIKDYATGSYGFIMAGQTNSYSYYGYSTDILIVKTDENGSLNKAKVIGYQGEDIAYCIRQVKGGDFVVTGSTAINSDLSKMIFVIRLDKDLNILWQKVLRHCEFPFDNVGYGVIENPLDGSLTVTGVTESFGEQNSQDAFLLNFKDDGSFNWLKTYGTKHTEQGVSIEIGNGGKEYVVSGYAIGEDQNKDAFVFKTDMFGNLNWSNLYGGINHSVEEGAEITSNGMEGFIFTGFAESPTTINRDFYLVNLKENGESGGCQRKFPIEVKRHKPCIFSYFQSVDVKDHRFVCTQYEKVEYNVKECSSERAFGALTRPQAEETEMLSVTPNPSSTSVHIVLQKVEPGEGSGLLSIIDRDGKVVYATDVTSEDFSVPIGQLPNDLYIIQLSTPDGQRYQKKLLKE